MRWGGRLCLLVLAAGAAAIAFEWATWPDVGALAKTYPKTTAFIEEYKAQQRREGKSDAVSFAPVPYARISPHLKRAALVSEDIGFFSHHGFAVDEIKETVKEAWKEKELPTRGASTITQQLAKNLWLSPSRNPLRKLKEAALTRELERKLPKKRILELYLDVAEFGPGVYGAEAAARRYFGKSAAALDEHEAALLIAGLPRPKSWHPGSTSPVYLRRVQIIEARMAIATWIRQVI
ncbi:MAG: biosynthetic peptidoglycan transglycosylase [Candidatus Polarisedimenticolia bacterium]